MVTGHSTGGSYMVSSGGAECRDAVKRPAMPAGTGPRLPQKRAGNVGYPEGAAWV